MTSRHSFSKKAYLKFSQICWNALYAWKLILIFSILVALIISGAKYYQILSLDNSTTFITNRSSSEAASALSESEKLSVDQAYALYVAADSAKQYLSSSTLAKVNPYRVHTFNIYYSVTSSSDSALSSCKDMYMAYMSGASLASAISPLINDSTENTYELISVDGIGPSDSNISPSGIIHFSVILPEDFDTSRILSAVEGSIDTFNSQVTAAIGVHSIRRFLTEDTIRADYDLATRMINMQLDLEDATNTNRTLTKGFTPSQTAYYQSLLYEKNKNAIDSSSNSSPAFPWLYALIGFLIGILISFIFAIIISLSSKTVTSADELKHSMGLRLLGQIYDYIPAKGLKIIMKDRMMFNARYKRLLNTSRQSRASYEYISMFLKAKQQKDATLVCLDELNESQTGYLDDIIKEADNLYMILKGPLCLKEDGRLADISKETCVILIVVSGRTTYSMLENAFDSSRDFDVPIAGAIFLDC